MSIKDAQKHAFVRGFSSNLKKMHSKSRFRSRILIKSRYRPSSRLAEIAFFARGFSSKVDIQRSEITCALDDCFALKSVLESIAEVLGVSLRTLLKPFFTRV